MDDQIEVREVDLENSSDAGNLMAVLEQYARDPMGGGAGLSNEVKENLVTKLKDFPGAISYLAFDGGEPVGLLNAFTGFSTFKAKPLLNIHDVYVSENYRQRGVAARLFEAAESVAMSNGYCKLTLEVLSGNHPAKNLYRRLGFIDYALDPEKGSALFWEKSL